MRLVLSVLTILVTFLFITPKAHAIIFLPAIVLIPIAQIIAFIFGGFAIPTLGIGALWGKLAGKSMKKTILLSVLILILLTIAIALFLKFENPERPLF
jgi:hypothetical protein